MEILYGARALPDFRLERMRGRLSAAIPALDLQDARFFYLFSGDLPAGGARKGLESFFEEGVAGEPAAAETLRVVVVPRFGTVSPWSSKASEILAGCGLGGVGRVERGVGYALRGPVPAPVDEAWSRLAAVLSDRMVEVMLPSIAEGAALFRLRDPEPDRSIALTAQGEAALLEADERLGLALGAPEREYLLAAYGALGRDPSETELMMFAQVNSEHCRHKIFRGNWTLDGEAQGRSPFDCIRESYRAHPEGILSAYRDNAAVIAGADGRSWSRDPASGIYTAGDAALDVAIKVETHNHPTAVAPFAGAATGAGGEIRDEAATGRGGSPKAGVTGFAVSDLRLAAVARSWEEAVGTPAGLASALRIMLEAPIGAASFNNEYGRPAIAGFFRSFCVADPNSGPGRFRGYHKPVMLAGGIGSIRRPLIEKKRFGAGAKIVVLGGPAFAIGLGGGAASSRAGGRNDELDFASVQRGNPEMQRRAQEVIEAATALGESNPILAIHDVGAGGLANAVPELLHEAGLGGRLDLALVPSADSAMSALALWCNESQERYVLALAPEEEAGFAELARRERCPWAVIGEATDDGILRVIDGRAGATVVDLAMQTLLGDLPPLA
ncbi:MAG TPA: AIR synthase-related protein, partial [Gammaproteobacteria bacterium]|nr:AIR synthase-related protein [Gammaproteobacteria bacterium]